MATAAQVFANQANAKHSTGPVTPEGKARASHNATALGLFSASAFIRAEEHQAYEGFRAAWNARLVPDGPLEETLVGELVQAAWRLRRCTLLETTPRDETTPADDLDHLQDSIDRARVTAQRALQRNLNELRRIQTDRQMRDAAPYGHQAQAEYGAASIREIDNFVHQIVHRYPRDSFRMSPAAERENSKRSQSAPAPRADSAERSQSEKQSIPRSAPCPCGSGEKYKRCCGKNAPALLSQAAGQRQQI